MGERIAIDVAAAERLHERYLAAAAALHDIADQLAGPLGDASVLVPTPPNLAADIAALGDRVGEDGGDLRWRIEYLIAADAARLADGRLSGDVPALTAQVVDATLVWSVIFGDLDDFSDDLGAVYSGAASRPTSLHHQWPGDAAARFDFSNDACSSPVGNSPWGHDFTLACQKHDFGYRNLKNLDERYSPDGEHVYWNEHSRALVDAQFGEDLAAVCEPTSGLSAVTCNAAAEAYVGAVQFGGNGFQWHDVDDVVETVQDYLFPWTAWWD
jgi:hypothetical protein